MPDMLQDGLAWLTDQLMEYASQPIVYSRKTNSVATRAMLGAKLLKINDGFGGLRIQWTDLDFEIPTAGFFFTYGDLIIPHRGDLVTLTIAGDTQSFEVFPFGDDPPWRWSDPHQTLYRVHTKLIDIGGAYV